MPLSARKVQFEKSPYEDLDNLPNNPTRTYEDQRLISTLVSRIKVAENANKKAIEQIDWLLPYASELIVAKIIGSENESIKDQLSALVVTMKLLEPDCFDLIDRINETQNVEIMMQCVARIEKNDNKEQ